jgi:ribosomal protein L7/L12
LNEHILHFVKEKKMGLISVRSTVDDIEVLYDRSTLARHNPNPQPIEMRFTHTQLDAAKLVVRYTGSSHKIDGVKIIRGISDMGLIEAKTLWELAKKQI